MSAHFRLDHFDDTVAGRDDLAVQAQDMFKGAPDFGESVELCDAVLFEGRPALLEADDDILELAPVFLGLVERPAEVSDLALQFLGFLVRSASSMPSGIGTCTGSLHSVQLMIRPAPR